MRELLSPAGNMEAFAAAVKNGADAVYLGLTDFSARAGADNFDEHSLPDALSLCHSAGVKVYVTLNTLLRDREMPLMEQHIRFLAESGVDGVIVQDTAVAALVRSVAPELPLHGSTQMCIYSLDGALALKALGFCRVVLARELSLEEIRYIAEHSGMEIEVFVHGALCMCYSGHCYFSAVVGRNSGNRGRCAQPCRLPYEGGHPLSLKDLSLLSHVEALKEAGVCSFKIEGRLKSAAYVGSVTAAFANALRGKAPDEQTIKHLTDIFSRDGFTDGYLTGKTGREMFGTKQKTEYADYKAAVSADQERKTFKRFPLNAQLSATVGQGARWTFTDGKYSVLYEGEEVSAAQNKPLDEETLATRLDKLSDTHYTLGYCVLNTTQSIFLPVSAINEARRQGCLLLDQKRTEGGRPHYALQENTLFLPQPIHRHGQIQVLYHSISAFDENTDHSRFAAVWLPAEQADLYKGTNRGAHIDHFTPESALRELITLLKEAGVPRVLVGNLGHIKPFLEAGFEVWGDYALNITNSHALAEYQRLGLKNACLSFELSLPQIHDLNLCMPTTLITYGRLPLMQFKNCVIRQKGRCLHHEGHGKLTDRKGHEFLLSCRPYCGNTLFNSLPLYLESEQLQGFESCDKRIDFTDESPARARQILQNIMNNIPMEGEFTKGLYHRGVL